MNIREQAKTIIHERMHALPIDIPHDFIADFTVGIGLILELYNDQINGRRPVLTTEQIRKISVFRRRIMQTG